VKPLWTRTLSAVPRGLALARERGWLLAWDDTNWLYLFNRAGERQAQMHMAGTVAAACCAEDGSAYAAVGGQGEVWWLAPDLMKRWERSVPHPALAAAMDPFGQYLAVSDARGHVHVFDRLGRPVFQAESPRPFHRLAFVPASPVLLGCADYGLVACLDFKGKWLWRDGLVAHIGSLAVSGSGELIVLACFSEGLQRYSLAGKRLGRLAVAEPCRLAALTFDGKTLLVGGLGTRLLLLDGDGRTLATHPLEKPAVALAFGALGHHAYVALGDGVVLGLDLRKGTVQP
jgi:hypothetical protein